MERGTRGWGGFFSKYHTACLNCVHSLSKNMGFVPDMEWQKKVTKPLRFNVRAFLYLEMFAVSPSLTSSFREPINWVNHYWRELNQPELSQGYSAAQGRWDAESNRERLQISSVAALLRGGGWSGTSAIQEYRGICSFWDHFFCQAAKLPAAA